MNSGEVSFTKSGSSKNDRRAIQICGFFVLLTAALLVTPAVGPMRYGFPALSFLFAYFVYRQSKPFYAGFVVWLWMLAPLVRRIVEYRAGGAASLIISAPFLACAVPLLISLTSVAELVSLEGYPLLFAGAGIAYGLGVGVLLHNHLALIASGLAFWVAPLLFALFLVQSRSQVLEVRASVEKAITWGVVAIGAYGIYQYFILAPWDALWIETANLVSIGLPEARQLRVFSTMNSPQTLGVFLIAGIFIALRSGTKLKWLAIPFASFSLLLTQSRTAWFGFIAGFLYLMFYLPAKQKLQIAVAGAISIILVLGALQSEQKEILTARLQTLTAPGEDGSFAIRMAGYAVLLPTTITNPFGAGIGVDEGAENSPTVNSGSGLGFGDSTIVVVLLSLGLPGTLMYLTGLSAALWYGFRRHAGADRNETVAFRAIVIALVVCAPANDVLLGSSGFIAWMALILSYLGLARRSAVPQTSEVARELVSA